jgi:hypothetical protein
MRDRKGHFLGGNGALLQLPESSANRLYHGLVTMLSLLWETRYHVVSIGAHLGEYWCGDCPWLDEGDVQPLWSELEAQGIGQGFQSKL